MSRNLSPGEAGVLQGYQRGDSVTKIASDTGLKSKSVTRIANRLRVAGYTVPKHKPGAKTHDAGPQMNRVCGWRDGCRVRVHSLDRDDALAELIRGGAVPDA